MCSRVPITQVLGEIWSFNKNSLHLDIWTFGLDPPGGRAGVQGPQFEFFAFKARCAFTAIDLKLDNRNSFQQT